MDLIVLKEKIKTYIKEEPIIEFISKTGSILFCENCKDTDYIVVIENDVPSFKIYDKEINEDFFIKSRKTYNKYLNFEGNNLHNLFIIENLFIEKQCIYGKATVELDLLGKKEQYKTLLKTVLPKSFLNTRFKHKNSDKFCHPHLWWVILGLKLIENNSYEITLEIKNLIQQCHDGVLDKSWENYIKEKLQ